MKQGVLQDESIEIHVALMSNGGEQQEHEETTKKLEENSGEEEQHGNGKQNVGIAQQNV